MFPRAPRAFVLCAALIATGAPLAADWTVQTSAPTVATFNEPLDTPVAVSGNRYWVSWQQAYGGYAVARVDGDDGTIDGLARFDAAPIEMVAAPDGGLTVLLEGEAINELWVARMGADGGPRWVVSVSGPAAGFHTLLAASGGDAIVVTRTFTNELRLVRVRGDDGALAWSRFVDAAAAECTSGPDAVVARGERVLVPCTPPEAPDHLRTFSAVDGSDAGDPALRIDGGDVAIRAGWSDPSNDAYFGVLDLDGAKLVRVNPLDGTLTWASPVLPLPDTQAATASARGKSGITDITGVGPLGSGMVHVSSYGSATAVRRSNGTLAWTRDVGPLTSDAAGNAYAVGEIGVDFRFSLTRVSAVDGSTLWSYESPADEIPAQLWRKTAVGNEGVALRVTHRLGPQRSTLALQVFTPAGAVLRMVPLVAATDIRELAELAAPDTVLVPYLVDDVQSSRAMVRNVDAGSGQTRWDVEAYASSEASVATNGTCRGTDGTVVVATGSPRWSELAPSGIGRVVGLDPATGQRRWLRELSSGSIASTAFVGICDGTGAVYLQVQRGPTGVTVPPIEDSVLALRASDGAVLWERGSQRARASCCARSRPSIALRARC